MFEEPKSAMIEIRYGIHSSPFGWCVIGLTKGGVCSIRFLEKNSDKAGALMIKKAWPKATLVRDDKATALYAKKIFTLGKKQRVPFVLNGTDFQVKVWEALLAIPRGKTTTYTDIARSIGRPNAVRAVGSACGKNSIAYLIPCHRVLTSSGGIGGYNGGIARKKAMLEWEAARVK